MSKRERELRDETKRISGYFTKETKDKQGRKLGLMGRISERGSWVKKMFRLKNHLQKFHISKKMHVRGASSSSLTSRLSIWRFR